MRTTIVSIITSLALITALTGCHDPEPVDETETGALEESDERVQQDNSPYDEYTFEADARWMIIAEMTSTEFDTYLWLIGPDGSSLFQDDDGGPERNSLISWHTTKRGTYTLRANSFDENGRGAYQLRYTAREGSPEPEAEDSEG